MFNIIFNIYRLKEVESNDADDDDDEEEEEEEEEDDNEGKF